MNTKEKDDYLLHGYGKPKDTLRTRILKWLMESENVLNLMFWVFAYSLGAFAVFLIIIILAKLLLPVLEWLRFV